jgi:hypothetical protein
MKIIINVGILQLMSMAADLFKEMEVLSSVKDQLLLKMADTSSTTNTIVS